MRRRAPKPLGLYSLIHLVLGKAWFKHICRFPAFPSAAASWPMQRLTVFLCVASVPVTKFQWNAAAPSDGRAAKKWGGSCLPVKGRWLTVGLCVTSLCVNCCVTQHLGGGIVVQEGKRLWSRALLSARRTSGAVLWFSAEALVIITVIILSTGTLGLHELWTLFRLWSEEGAIWQTQSLFFSGGNRIGMRSSYSLLDEQKCKTQLEFTWHIVPLLKLIKGVIAVLFVSGKEIPVFPPSC